MTRRSAISLCIFTFISALSITSLASHSDPEFTGINFSQYKVSFQKTLTTVTDNLSGITYSSDTDSLFAIINNPEQIVELDKQGKILRQIPLTGFVDTEGITYLGQRHFALMQERQRSVSVVEITSLTRTIDVSGAKQFNLKPAVDNNAGLEGIAWSAQSGLFVANEHSPSEIIHLPSTLISGLGPHATDHGNIMPRFLDNLPLDDISGLHFTEQAEQLLVLSDESRELLAIDADGTIHSQFDLSPGWFGFNPYLEQPEGVTMDNHGLIYIVGEPNNLLVLAPQ